MTGKQLYDQALALLGLEQEDVSWMEAHAADCINQMLSDHLHDQGMLRLTRGQRMLDSAPVLSDLEEEIPYDEMFVRECFPYGLAALLIAEEDHTMFNWMMSEYERRAAYYAPCVMTQIRETDT